VYAGQRGRDSPHAPEDIVEDNRLEQTGNLAGN